MIAKVLTDGADRMRNINNEGKACPRFGHGWIVLACHLSIAACCPAALPEQQAAGVAPFYRSFQAVPKIAQSMVYGPGTIEGGPLPRTTPQVMSRPVASAQCEHVPEDARYRTITGLESATAAQTRDLGLVLRTRSGASEPFLTGQIVLLRTGRYADCKSTTQERTLIYGSEWIVGFLLQASRGAPPRTFAELASRIRQGELLELGYVVRGGTQGGALEKALRPLPDDWNNDETRLLQQLQVLQTAWPASRFKLEDALPLGVSKP